MKYDVALATSTYFGGLYGNVTDPDYRRTMFAALCRSLYWLEKGNLNVCWVIGDDCSPSGPPENLPVMIDTYVCTRTKNVGQPKNYMETVQRACERADWVLVVDDDGEVAPDALERMFWLVDKYPKADCYGAFNSPYHQAVEVFDDHVLKQSNPEHGRFFRSEWGGFGLTKELVPVLRPSAIQHCGKYGLNGTADDYDTDFGRRTALSAGQLSAH